MGGGHGSRSIERYSAAAQLRFYADCTGAFAVISTLADLRRSIDLVATPMAVLDLDGRIEHINPANEALLGHSAAELCGRSFDDILPHGHAQRGAALLTSARAKGHAGGIFQHKRSDGSRVLVEVLANAVSTAVGDPAWIITATRDLGPQVRQVEQITASALRLAAATTDDFLETMIRVARDLVGARYAALGVVEAGRLVRFLSDGLTEDEMAAIDHRPDGHGLLGAMITERRTIRITDLPADPRSSGFPPGHPAMRSFLGTPILVGDDVFGHLYLAEKLDAPEFSVLDERLAELFAAHASVEIRDRARRNVLETASQALDRREAELRDRVILDHVRDSVIVTDLDGRITHWNQGAETVFGYDADEMVGQTMAMLYPDQDMSGLATDLAAIMAGQDFPGEWLARHRDGKPVWIDVRTTLMRDAHDQPVGFIAISHDITARRIAETERTAAEVSLLRSEHSLAHLRRVTQLGSWEWDLATNEVARSDEHARIYGIEPGAFKGINDEVIAFSHPDDRSAVIEADRRSAEEGAPYDLIHRIIRPDGSERTVHDVGDVIRNDAGVPVRVVGAIEDITDRLQVEARQSRMARLLDEVNSEIYVFDAGSLRFTEANAGALRNIGYTLEELRELTPLDIKPEETEASFARRLAPLISGEADQAAFTTIHRRKDGSTYPVEVRVDLIAEEAPPVFVGVVQDIGDRVAAEADRMRLASAVEQAADSIIISDPHHTVTYVNRSFCRLYGYSPDEVVGRQISILDSRQQTAEFWAQRWATLQTGAVWSGSIINRRKDGSHVVVESVTAPILDPAGRVESIVQTDRDVTRELELEDALERDARERETIGAALERIDPAASPEEIAAAACDAVVRLQEVQSAWVVELWPGGGRIAAAGGLVAGTLSPGQEISVDRARNLLERATAGPWAESWVTREVRDSYGEKLVATGLQASVVAPLRGAQGVVGVIVFGSHDPDGADRIIQRLPAVATFGSIIGALVAPALENRRRGEGDLADIRAIIDDGAFRPFFQPIVDLRTGAVVGYEALSRFHSGTRPDSVFAEAARVGLGLELEVATLRAASMASSVLPPGRYLSLNASPELIGAGVLTMLLAEIGRPVVLEVTEHVVVDDYKALRRRLRALGTGVRLAVDDAGAGYASLRHILELRPDFVKLDMGLIRGIDADPARQALLAGIAYFAAKRRIRLIAEGIETPAELERLRSLAVSHGQGYLLGRPQDAAGPGSWPTTVALPD